MAENHDEQFVGQSQLQCTNAQEAFHPPPLPPVSELTTLQNFRRSYVETQPHYPALTDFQGHSTTTTIPPKSDRWHPVDTNLDYQRTLGSDCLSSSHNVDCTISAYRHAQNLHPQVNFSIINKWQMHRDPQQSYQVRCDHSMQASYSNSQNALVGASSSYIEQPTIQTTQVYEGRTRDDHSYHSQEATSTIVQQNHLRNTILSFSRSVPYFVPRSRNRREFSSTCAAGDASIILTLQDANRWRAMRPRQMEMIINSKGRRIFPYLSVNVSGLEPDGLYTFALDLMSCGNSLLKYENNAWRPLRETKNYPPAHQNSILHIAQRSCQLGSDIERYGIDLSSLKITNNGQVGADVNQIFAYSRLKYLPRYHIVRHMPQDQRQERPPLPEYVGTYIIPELTFVTTTVYCDPHIKRTKIMHNPYCMRFRN